MIGNRTARRLIINADDFGRSSSANEAVLRAHTEGVLTTASLMVNEEGFAEATALARSQPRLGVGLHLSLLCGKSALPPPAAPGLVDENGNFKRGPVSSGMSFFFASRLKEQLRAEIHEQFKKFRSTSLRLDHVNGHLHMHLHPTVLSLLLEDARKLGITRMRLTVDPLMLNLRIARGAWFYRVSHAIIFGALSRRARCRLQHLNLNIRHTEAVFGLLQNGRVDESYVCRLLERLPPGDSELYSHPCVRDFRPEFEALISPRVRDEIARQGIALIRYQDL